MARRSDYVPNLCPTSTQPLPDLGPLNRAPYPTYPTFSTSRVYRTTKGAFVFACVMYRSGRLGRSGRRLNRAALRLPNLCPTSGMVGQRGRGSFLAAPNAGNSDPDCALVTRVFPGGCHG